MALTAYALVFHFYPHVLPISDSIAVRRLDDLRECQYAFALSCFLGVCNHYSTFSSIKYDVRTVGRFHVSGV